MFRQIQGGGRGQGGDEGAEAPGDGPADGPVDHAGRHAGHGRVRRAQDRRGRPLQERPGGAGGAAGQEAPGGLGAAAGGGPSASHETDPAAVTDNRHGRQAGTPQEIPAPGWKDIAKRTMKSVKEDQVPLLSAGVAFYALLSLFPLVIAAVSIYGLAADPRRSRNRSPS